MNKRLTTVLFLLGATVLNVILVVAVFLILLFIPPLILGNELLQTQLQSIIPVIFVLSLVGAFLIYRFILKQVQKRIDLSKYIEPFFRRKK